MIKYFINNDLSRMGKFNTETEEFDAIKYSRPQISDMYIIPEDGTIDGKEVHKGDIVLQMYPISRDGKQEVIIISDEGLKDFYARAEEFQRQQQANDCCQCDCIQSYSGR